MTDNFNIQLLSLIKDKPHLFDEGNSYAKNKNVIDSTWETIGVSIGKTGELVNRLYVINLSRLFIIRENTS